MDRIYQMPDRSLIDLGKIISVGPIYEDRAFCQVDIFFQGREKPLIARLAFNCWSLNCPYAICGTQRLYDSWTPEQRAENTVKQATRNRENLIGAWKCYLNNLK